MEQIDVSALSAHLASAVPQLVSVGHARDLASASRETVRFPSAWIVLLAEDASETRYASDDAVEQQVTGRVAVILAIRDIADRAGARAGEDLKTMRSAVLLALGRHVPAGADQAFRFSRGQLLSGVDSRGGLFWQDEFTLRFDRRIQIT